MVAALLLAVGALTYANTVHNPFVFDDDAAIAENPHIRHLWPPSRVLTAPPGSGASGRPLVALSLAANYSVGGLDPFGYHVFNAGAHLLVAWVLFALARCSFGAPRLCGRRFGGSATALALAVLLIWIVHPLLQLEPDNVMAQCNLGLALLRKGELDEAVAAFRAALRIEPDMAEVNHYLGAALLQQRKFTQQWNLCAQP